MNNGKSTADSKPDFEWRPKNKFHVDPSYQRGIETTASQKLIQKISENWDWRRCGILQAVNGGALVDGQHRWAAAMKVDVVKELPCFLWKMGIKEAADMFVGLNGDRVNLHTLYMFRAELAASKPEALKVKEVCEKAGAEAMTYPMPIAKMELHQTQAVATIKAQIKVDEARATSALRCCVVAKVSLTATAIKTAFFSLTMDMPEAKVIAQLRRIGTEDYIPQGAYKPPVAIAPAQPKDGVRKFEAGSFMDILEATFRRASVSYEVVAIKKMGQDVTLKINGKQTDLIHAVQRANLLRATAGFAPLTVPKG